MPKPMRGRAGREGRKANQRDTYGEGLANLMFGQVRAQPDSHLLHLGYPGAIDLITKLAPRIPAGQIVVLVYTYDELEETREALSEFEQVSVINEFDELDPDTRFDLVTSIAPYHLGPDYIGRLIELALSKLKSTGVFSFAGDRRFDFERFVSLLVPLTTETNTVATRSHEQVIQVDSRNIRRRGSLVKRNI